MQLRASAQESTPIPDKCTKASHAAPEPQRSQSLVPADRDPLAIWCTTLKDS